MLLVWHKTCFRENEAAWQCVTMWKRSVSIRATKWHLTFWHRYHQVKIMFLWPQLHVSIAQKRGSPPLNVLYENECWLHGLHDGVKKIGGQNVSEVTIYTSYIYVYIYVI